MLRDLASARLRANPANELVSFERLTDAEAALLSDAVGAAGAYGVLRSRDGHPPYRSVDEDTALLLYTLATPGPLPTYARAKLGASASRALADLVLAGVLEVEHEGRFVSGPAAHAACFVAGDGDAPAAGRTAELSREAVRHGQHLALGDADRLALRLYLYNRAPLTPAWQERLPGPEAVLAHLGAGDAPLRTRLDRRWALTTSDAWLSWTTRRPANGTPRDDRTHKLYLSPTLDALPQVFAAWVEAADALRAFSFKLGRDAQGLLRPDKFVAYFTRFDDLAEAARALEGPLAGCPAQGVPFTAGITPDGLLSWGVDPPAAAVEERESWRLWVAGCLARALVEAAREPDGTRRPEAWRYALDRVRLEGVDPDTWRPSDTLWATWLREWSAA